MEEIRRLFLSIMMGQIGYDASIGLTPLSENLNAHNTYTEH
jgi:hypothetical protein